MLSAMEKSSCTGSTCDIGNRAPRTGSRVPIRSISELMSTGM